MAAQLVELGLGALERLEREPLCHRADRPLAVGQRLRAAPVERDAIGHHGIAPGVAQRGAVSDEAVQAAVRHRDDDRDHLALGGAQARRLLVEHPEVCEPGGEPFGAVRVGAEDVRDEADALARGTEQALQLGRQVGLVGDREPGDAVHAYGATAGRCQTVCCGNGISIPSSSKAALTRSRNSRLTRHC